uniref:MFS transporter n=1 Tax=Cyberlindnera americana TaxID=36016 RepID=A0A5P8N8K0_9ASCO|nr:MFS transporter [Cyberlindnera americana]
MSDTSKMSTEDSASLHSLTTQSDSSTSTNHVQHINRVVTTESLNRVHTVSSLNPNPTSRRFSSRRGSQPVSISAEDYEEFTEKNIYPDLDSEEIALQRERTKNTIITALSQRVLRQEEAIDDEETQLYQGGDDENIVPDREEGLPTKHDGVEFQNIDPELVTWDGPTDPENPRNWTLRRKWKSIGVASMYTFLSPFASTMLSPAVSDISADFGNDTVIASLMVSIFILAWAIFSPLVAPLSEMYGRQRVLNVAAWFMLFFNIGCALAKNPTQMCVFRLLAGAGGCAPISIGAGVIGDLVDNKERGKAMALYSLGPTVGPCVSALIAGFIVQGTSWRWCFWVLVIVNGVVAAWGTLTLEETYSPQLLKNKAAKLRKLTGNQNLHCLYEIATGETTFDKFYINLTRPVVLLFTHPMVFGLGTFMAIAYGCLYILIVTFPSNWSDNYGFNSGEVGLMYITLLVGYMLGTLVTQRTSDYIYERLAQKNGGVSKPEYRIPVLFISGITLSVGLFWYGWGSEKHMPWIFPAVGAGIFCFGVIPVFYCIQNYLIDMNPRFAASSIAAASVFRSFFGFAFPLFSPKMFDNLGTGWGCSIFGFLILATGIPFPVYVFLYGEKLRLWANKRTERSQAKTDQKNMERLAKKQEKELQKLQEKK